MRIAITTPTGNIGRKLVAELLAKGGHDLILVARHPEKLAAQRSLGVRVVQADLMNADAVVEATKGAEALFWLNPPDMRSEDVLGTIQKLARNAAAAARAHPFKHVVLLSSIGAHLGPGVGPISGLHLAERILGAAAPSLTILRPGYFMENYMMALGSIAEVKSVFLPVSGTASIPMTATADTAAAAARALAGDPPKGVRVVPLHGPRDYTFDDAARLIGEGLGEKVSHVRVSASQAREAMRGLGVSDHVAGVFLEMYEAIDSGRLVAEYPRSAATTTPTRIEDFARQMMAPALQAQRA
jgi:uncharacterized protein YbjT (DUF2867 family)